jgi:ZIP family zinc transporter
MESPNILLAFGLTVFAGLSTGVGSAIAFFAKKTNTRVLTIALGLSAGVMIYISFMEIFSQARISLINYLGPIRGGLTAIGSFFAGITIIAVIDRLVPDFENPHELSGLKNLNSMDTDRDRRFYRMGIFSALAIAIHNFPEGMATLFSALENIKVGVAIAIAIAVHNIPEGIAVSIPIFYATGNRKKAFFYSFLSGLAEPVGAVLGYFILVPLINYQMFGIINAMVAGIMVFVALDELLPSAREFGHHHLAIYSMMLGMLIMALSMIFLM